MSVPLIIFYFEFPTIGFHGDQMVSQITHRILYGVNNLGRFLEKFKFLPFLCCCVILIKFFFVFHNFE